MSLRVWTAPNILKGVGLEDIVVEVADSWWTEANNPSIIQPGEHSSMWRDSTVPTVLASQYTSSTNLGDVLRTLASSAFLPPHVHVELDLPLYWITHAINYGTETNPNWLGYVNSNKRIIGMYSDNGSKVRVSPTAVNDTPGARDYALNPNLTNPVPFSLMYFSMSGVSEQFFMYGLEFQGTLQTPFSVYSTNAQTKFRQNASVASPLPFRGFSLWVMNDKSMIKKVRFSGFSFSLNSAPPYEMGTLDTNRDNGFLIEDVYLDGRLAAEVDSLRRRVSGGVMLNKSQHVTLNRVMMEYTRRSGLAQNTNTKDVNEIYEFFHVQIDNNANAGNDGWASDIQPGTVGAFAGLNLEGMLGRVYVEDMRVNVAMGSHIQLAIPATGSDGSAYVIPNRPLIYVKGLKSKDSVYNGLGRTSTSSRPNSTGVSPAWQKLKDFGIAGSNLYEWRNSSLTLMTGVRHNVSPTPTNAETTFVVTYSDTA